MGKNIPLAYKILNTKRLSLYLSIIISFSFSTDYVYCYTNTADATDKAKIIVQFSRRDSRDSFIFVLGINN